MTCYYLIFIIYIINCLHSTFQYAQTKKLIKKNETAKLLDRVFQNDMILTKSDIKIFFDNNDTSKSTETTLSQDEKLMTFYTALAPTSPKRWVKYFENGTYYIPYNFDKTIKNQEKNLVLKCMNIIAQHTCIQFRKRTTEINYLNIQSTIEQGCFSYVGMRGGKQIIQLGNKESSTCFLKRIITHELLHSVGLYHEHMRKDRDDYIIIHKENIKEGAEIQFQKIVGSGVSTYDTPYDYLSIMHYGKNFFAKDDKLITIEPRNRKFLNLIGRRETPSFYDWEKVCEMYQCTICNNNSYKLLDKSMYFLNYLFLLIVKNLFL
ncbi:Astacin-like metalloendopeptidase [Strongyloides ratti]|uniref:Metalloendopeptidase n=1 Tax=Strongyloides ratti TaxID=34506 RepID=A0A090MXS2_STRRB|nr:Astacin-like metalloendopeptidase [Strongyloides ratti]CEF65929.1 Astacin-like metalloendopeptidase [Strongyloides ratti]